MKIAVNTRFLRPNKIEGTGRFTVEILKRLVAKHPEVTFHFLFDGFFSDEFVFGPNVVPHIIPPPARHPLLWRIWFYQALPIALRAIQPDVFISPDGLLPKKLSCPSIPIIHDLNFLSFPQFLPKRVFSFYEDNFKHAVKTGNRIVTVSNFSKKDITEKLQVPSEKIDVIGNAVDTTFCPISKPEKDKFLFEKTDGKRYFLYVGAMNPRKNLERTLMGFDAFLANTAADIDLYLAGSEMFKSERVRDVINEMQFGNRVKLLGWLSDVALKRWLAAADGFVYTSLFEGFGIPILEAFASGVPVLTSTTTSMPEVGGQAAFYANPIDTEAIASGMTNLYEKGHERIAQGFQECSRYSWDKSADQLWATILEVSNSQKANLDDGKQL